MRSEPNATDKERAERQQLNETLAVSRAKASESGARPNGTRSQGLVRALRQRQARTGMSFYDEYVQAANEKASAGTPRQPANDVDPAPEGNGGRNWHGPQFNDQTRQSPEHRADMARTADQVENGGATQAPRGRAELLPSVIGTDQSVFSLLAEQVDDLRRQKRELQEVIEQQDQKICELIALIHRLMSQPEETMSQLHTARRAYATRDEENEV